MSVLIPKNCKFYNLVCPQNDEGEVLLGRKTRGFGEGKLVLPGGKPSDIWWPIAPVLDVLSYDAARELNEESGVSLPVHNMGYAGALYVGQPVERMVTLFRCAVGHRLPRASDEVIDWRFYGNVPYNETPEDYELWLPSVLSGKLVIAHLVGRSNTMMAVGGNANASISPSVRE
jgi:8-oxo-dGTP diphosphatase